MQNKIACNHVQFYLVNSFTVRASEHVYFYFILFITCCFSARQLNYCTGVPRGTGFFPWGSAPVKRLKTSGLERLCCTWWQMKHTAVWREVIWALPFKNAQNILRTSMKLWLKEKWHDALNSARSLPIILVSSLVRENKEVPHIPNPIHSHPPQWPSPSTPTLLMQPLIIRPNTKLNTECSHDTCIVSVAPWSELQAWEHSLDCSLCCSLHDQRHCPMNGIEHSVSADNKRPQFVYFYVLHQVLTPHKVVPEATAL